jgi:shikimate dehydrogenase
MRAITASTTLVGILGWPVSHSLSPAMHNAAFAALDLDWAYVPLPTPPERVAEAVRGLAAAGFAGLNVTIPHKGAVLDLCDDVEPSAAHAGSVNTLVFDDGKIRGSSTDIVALDRAVESAAGTALVLGTGGSARAAVAALGRFEVTVLGRRDAGWPPDGRAFDVVVNATPVKDDAVIAPRAGQVIVDLPYRPVGSETALVTAARRAGAAVVDGLDLLLWQGAASFERWTGRRAPVDVMSAALRKVGRSGGDRT